MPTRNDFNKKPWIAIVKRDRKQHYLGCYSTREEAVAVEDAFKKENPGPGKAWPNTARKRSAEVRAQLAAERHLAGIYVAPPAEPKKPLSAHERAIERALRAM